MHWLCELTVWQVLQLSYEACEGRKRLKPERQLAVWDVWPAIVRLNVPQLSQAPETDPTDGVQSKIS